MSIVLKGCVWSNYINGTVSYPVDKNIKRCELHDKESDLALSLIVQCMDKGQYIYVQHTESTKDAWDTLSQHYKQVLSCQQSCARIIIVFVTSWEVTHLNT